MSTPIIDIRRPGPCGPRAAADARTASHGRLVVLRRLSGSASGSDPAPHGQTAVSSDVKQPPSTMDASSRL